MLLLGAANKLVPIKEQPFSIEKDIQHLIEDNLTRVLNLELVCSELGVKNYRIDTLAFDVESKAFIIIEYKKNKTFSVIDQGFTYLSLMLNNKADFVLAYNESVKVTLKKKKC